MGTPPIIFFWRLWAKMLLKINYGLTRVTREICKIPVKNSRKLPRSKIIKILPVKTGKIIHAIQRKKIWAYYGRDAHRIKKEIMGGAPIE